ncbi:hypothetical protein AKO1_004690 [Acrasis kona]|uniref:Uncharacterized protein n=1 Tax=Acrasis kona TaxID=1008807 RepID=A0AAW2Z481_9EUKA
MSDKLTRLTSLKRMIKKIRRALSPRTLFDSKTSPTGISPPTPQTPSDETATEGAEAITPNQSTPTMYTPKVERMTLKRGYDSVILRVAETYLFDRNKSEQALHGRQDSPMMPENEVDRRLEQAYMEYISDAIVKDIGSTADDSESEESEDETEDDKSEQKMSAVLKKKLGKPKKRDVPTLKLHSTKSTDFIYTGDEDEFDETIKKMHKKGLFVQAAAAVRSVADLMSLTQDYRGAVVMYERACEAYVECGMLEQVVKIRCNDLFAPSLNLELFENFSDGLDWVLSNQPKDNQELIECFSILLRLSAFLKGDGSQGTYELKERVNESRSIKSQKTSELLNNVLDKVEQFAPKDESSEALHQIKTHLQKYNKSDSDKIEKVCSICEGFAQAM